MLFSRICLKKIVTFASWQVFYVNAGDNYRVDSGPLIRKRICATTCYLNPSEKDCFLAKMSEISGFDAIIFRIFKYIALG